MRLRRSVLFASIALAIGCGSSTSNTGSPDGTTESGGEDGGGFSTASSGSSGSSSSGSDSSGSGSSGSSRGADASDGSLGGADADATYSDASSGGADGDDGSTDATTTSSGGSSGSGSASSGGGSSSSGGSTSGSSSSGGDAAAACGPGQTQCSGLSAQQTCTSGGTWGSVVTCASNQTCVSGACGGQCGQGQTQCASGAQPQTCSSSGTWQNATACPSSQSCVAGACVTPASCQASGSGTSLCGSSSESCCTSLEVTGGMFHRTYSNSGSGPTGEADPATVSGFRLDKYLVTVGRFRPFVTAWNGGSGWTPPAGSGKHTHLNGGQGLASGVSAGTYETGWITSDNTNISPTDANLTTYCSSAVASTWTASAGANEKLPINCVNWYEAYAFCIWDGGFLAGEAEWEYAAAGGSQEREYPWGTMAPGMANQYAIYGDGTNCYYPTGTAAACTGVTNIAPVGTATLGAGLWGQLDMAGDVWEWNVDWYSASYVNPCTDCAYLTATSGRVFRGGYFVDAAGGLLPTFRSHGAEAYRSFGVGLRCARTP